MKPEPEKPAADKEPEVFTLPTSPDRPQLNIVGKIDLDALNQSTRPKKKPAPGQRNAAGQGDRKKRKRITGKEKVDIEKTSQQTGSDNRGDNRGGASKTAPTTVVATRVAVVAIRVAVAATKAAVAATTRAAVRNEPLPPAHRGQRRRCTEAG